LMPNPGQEFISGDFVQVSVKIEQTSEALLIPSESVIPELNTHVVYKVKQGKAAKTDVTIGTRTESEIQITSGLETGDTVIVTGLLEINDGDKVEVGEIKEKGTL
ncbi:MAG: efflux RND transporter periplasmic adaptor subunit, partial [Bacteroidales bacterium]